MVDDVGQNIPTNKSQEVPLSKLVAALPEMYQPILNHPDLSVRVTRTCEDRLSHIKQIYQSLEQKLGRPLRVLDLGCAQGFFSLSLAQLGATVCGVELQECNIAVCNALAKEHPEFKITFRQGMIEEVLLNLKQDEYDLVLGLSVFHHLVHIAGLVFVQKMISILAHAVTAGIYELALPNEPTKRSQSLPANPREVLNSYAFVHEAAQHSTHLRGIDRPFYIASNRCWFLNGQVGAFQKWKSESHELTSNGTRRYYFGDGCVIKVFTLEDQEFHDINIREHTNEVNFLKNPPAHFQAARLLLEGQHHKEVWLVREQLPGELLLDIMQAKKPYNARLIIEDILNQLSALEAAKLYHNDLRIWNILIESDGHATLIDYGAMTAEAKDRGWPYNVFLSFMIFLQEIITGNISIPDPVRPPVFNPEIFPEPYRSMLWKLFSQEPAQWSFTGMRDSLTQDSEANSNTLLASRSSVDLLLKTMEDACKIHEKTTIYWRRRAG